MKNELQVEWLGFPQAARVYSVSPSLLRREADQQRLRTRRIYKRRLTRPEWLAEWFERYAEPEGSEQNISEAA